MPLAADTALRHAPERAAVDHPGLAATAALLKALANVHRLAILLELDDGPRCVHELVGALGISQPLASQHLRVLRSIDMVRAERRGRETVYSLGDQPGARIVHDALVHARERSTA
ncbi:MAG: metalloregulator ArsR/SmtB family transcription factor [Actinomycetota bacterium]|nr:metalloregulator ArsR/SmtB family transcription factor [Actinomycetota bacterium]